MTKIILRCDHLEMERFHVQNSSELKECMNGELSRLANFLCVFRHSYPA
jgi:hypothetical protein